MRYYAIKIDGAPSSFSVVPGAELSGAQFSSVAMGQNDPGALRVMVQIEKLDHHGDGDPNSYVRIWGVSLDMLSQAANLCEKNIEVDGGMWPGLPLATMQAPQRGMLVQGTIAAGFGNWEGTDMRLDLIIKPGSANMTSTPTQVPTGKTVTISHEDNPNWPGNQPQSRLLNRKINVPRGIVVKAEAPSQRDFFGSITSAVTSLESLIATTFSGGGFAQKPINFIHNMQPNQLLSAAIQQTLSTAFPSAKLDIAISAGLKLAYQDAGFYQSFQQYCGYIKALSHSILGTQNYAGVKMWADGNTIHVKDGTSQSNSHTLNFTDLIGQPTWVSVNSIVIKTVMRADVAPGDTVTLPAGVQTTTTPSLDFIGGTNPTPLHLTFQGSFTVTRVLHTGDSRHPDSSQWCTTIEATTSGSGGGQSSAADTTASTNDTYGLPAGSPSNVTGPHRLMRRPVRRYH